MIISDKFKIIFLRNPKCASSSIRNMLFEFDDSFFYDSNNYYEKISKFIDIDKSLQTSAQWLFKGMDYIKKKYQIILYLEP